MSDRERILNKIQKCLRLSKSSNPHEAAAALRQAQGLMRQHGVSDDEVAGAMAESVLAITRAPFARKTPMNLAYLAAIVMKAFGVIAITEPAYVNGKPRTAFRYFGMQGRPQLAAYAHSVMERQLWAAWNEYRADKPELFKATGARMGFWVGWLQQVSATIMDFGGTKEEEDITRRAITGHYGGENIAEGKTNRMALDGSTHRAGKEAAEGFRIHRPMNGEGQRRLTN